MTAKFGEDKTSTQPQQMEKILRKTDSTTYEIIERTSQTTFTTSPKTRRRRNKTNVCRQRAEEIVSSFYPETEVSYTAIRMKMMTRFGLCSDKTVLSYLGRPKAITTKTMRQTVRYEKTGAIVPKSHTFRTVLPEVKGYLEIFGLATPIKKDGRLWFRLHHTFQRELSSDSCVPFNQESERGEVSKQVFSFSSNSAPKGVSELLSSPMATVIETEERES